MKTTKKIHLQMPYRPDLTVCGRTVPPAITGHMKDADCMACIAKLANS